MDEKQRDKQDDLLIICLLGEASPKDMVMVEAMRKTDQAFNKRYLEYKTLWDATKNLDDDEVTDIQSAFNRYKKKVNDRRDYHRLVKRKKVNRWMAFAASFLLIAVFGWLYWGLLRVKTNNIETQLQTAMTTLPDGSEVILNHYSRFEYPSRFSGKKRQVQLNNGEAFFKISHNKENPFIITAGGTLIRVVGTSFNVRNFNGTVEVIVETGVVQVSNNNHKVFLKAGDKLTISEEKGLYEKAKNPDQLYNYYRTKKFIANDTPLWRMVEVLNEAYGCHIVIHRKDLIDLPLNTTFENESLDKILDVISHTFKITVEKRQGTILLK